MVFNISNKSWTNPYATDAPKIYDEMGNYKGRLSSNLWMTLSHFKSVWAVWEHRFVIHLNALVQVRNTSFSGSSLFKQKRVPISMHLKKYNVFLSLIYGKRFNQKTFSFMESSNVVSNG